MATDPMLQTNATSRGGGAAASDRGLRLVEPALGRLVRDQSKEPLLTEGKAGKGGSGPIESMPETLERARSGDPDAFHALFVRFGKPVVAFIYHMVGDRGYAEELAQETFFRAFRLLDRMQPGTKISTWLFGIARNVAREAIRERRRNRREVGLDNADFSLLADGRADPGESFLSAELQRVIRRSLLDLTEDQRVVFVLKMMNKMRYQEISRITGSSIGKLKTDLHRARQQMRDALRPYLRREE